MALSISSALLSPRAPHGPPAPSGGGGADGDVDFFFFPFLIRYKSGRVQRLMGTDTVPASTDPATGVASRDVVIDAAAGLAARLYLPTTSLLANRTGKLPLVVFYHGGGFVTESAFSPTYQRYLNALASKAGTLVVSVDYRLAPEHRLPAAYDDAWAALRWAVRNARAGAAEPWLARHADASRLFLVGDSAGGNIAHNVAVRAGGEGLDVRGIALLDPYFWGKRPVPAETTDAARRRLEERTWDFVCGGRYGIDDPVVNPVVMPPEAWRRLPCSRVLVTVAGLDKLSARGRAYVHELRASGWRGEAELYETTDEYHVYFLTKPECEEAVKETEALVSFIHGDQVSAPSRMDA